MDYRVLGRTGFQISVIGLGGHEYARCLNPQHFPDENGDRIDPDSKVEQEKRNRLIERAISLGVNYFDTTLAMEAHSLGSALNKLDMRKEVYLSAEIINPLKKLEDTPKRAWRKTIREGINDRLGLLGTDYIDIFNLHTPENSFTEDRFETIIDTLVEGKERGEIKGIGATSHNPRFLAKLMEEYDCFDAITIPYNYHLRENGGILFPICESLNVGVIAMKPFSWPYYGVSFTHFSPVTEGRNHTPAQTSLRWILNSPQISSAIPGTNTIGELGENIGTLDKVGEIDDTILQNSLEVAQSSKGEAILRELSINKGLRRDIQYYAQRALNQK
jgi:aryl-alcohol dehydrogenase-like predicted oxidoreductase